MRTIRTKVYKFNELSKKVQETVLRNQCFINIETDWWESVYEDAERVGLKITDFSIEGYSYCNAEFTLSACEVAQNILNNHGEATDTYNTAESFMKVWQPVFNAYMETEEGETELMSIEEDFLKRLQANYTDLLKQEYKYLTSNETIIETIQANDYEFTKDGKMI